jgi:hypothetical protein
LNFTLGHNIDRFLISDARWRTNAMPEGGCEYTAGKNDRVAGVATQFPIPPSWANFPIGGPLLGIIPHDNTQKIENQSLYDSQLLSSLFLPTLNAPHPHPTPYTLTPNPKPIGLLL